MKRELGKRVALVASETTYAQKAEAQLRAAYNFSGINEAEVLVVLGGDGFMLETLHGYVDSSFDIYGMNLGTVGFLLNPVSYENLDQKIMSAEATDLHPLLLSAWRDENEPPVQKVAFNDVSVLRSSTQSAHLEVKVDGVSRIERLVGDGVLVSTSAGSGAYNASAGGPIIPLGTDILALTPITSSSHRNWRGALLDSSSVIEISVLDAAKRPVTVDADSSRVSNVRRIKVERDQNSYSRLLFDPGHALEERIMALQFG